MKKILSIIVACSIILGLFNIQVNSESISLSTFESRLNSLKGYTNVSQIYNSKYNGSACYKDLSGHSSWECMAWASKVFDTIWNSSIKQNRTIHRNVANICVGDYVRYRGNGSFDHSIFITKISGETLYYTDGNAGKSYNVVAFDKTTTKTLLQSRLNNTLYKSQEGQSQGFIIHHNSNNLGTGATQSNTSSQPAPQTGSGKLKNDLYTLKNASSGFMMNVYAGKDANGTKVTTWEYDGTTDQRIYLQHQGNDKYLLKFNASGAGRVIDVNRGASLSAPIDEHDKIDIWTADDHEAQLVYVNFAGNGAYTLELSSKPGYVISASNASAAGTNGTQLELLRYTGADYQKWIFCDTSANKVNPCNHTNTQEKAGQTRYEQYDDGYHMLVTSYDIYCSECGEKTGSSQDKTSRLPHSLISGKCTPCGYTEPVTETPAPENSEPEVIIPETEECKHEDAIQQPSSDKTSEISVKDEQYHIVKNYYDLYCQKCDKIITSDLIETYDEEHSMTNNVCDKCDYTVTVEEEPCNHGKTIKQASYDMQDEITIKDDKSHTVTLYYNSYCTECKTVISSNLCDTYDEMHTIYNNKCDICGYTKQTVTPNPNNDITVTLNGSPITFDQPPIIKNNRSLVPLRAIFEALGATVEWDGTAKTVTATKGDTVVLLTIGSNQIYVNGIAKTLDVPACITGNRTLAPARAVSESFDCKVDWDGELRRVLITTNEADTQTDNVQENQSRILKDFAQNDFEKQTLKMQVAASESIANYDGLMLDAYQKIIDYSLIDIDKDNNLELIISSEPLVEDWDAIDAFWGGNCLSIWDCDDNGTIKCVLAKRGQDSRAAFKYYIIEDNGEMYIYEGTSENNSSGRLIQQNRYVYDGNSVTPYEMIYLHESYSEPQKNIATVNSIEYSLEYVDALMTSNANESNIFHSLFDY